MAWLSRDGLSETTVQYVLVGHLCWRMVAVTVKYGMVVSDAYFHGSMVLRGA